MHILSNSFLVPDKHKFWVFSFVVEANPASPLNSCLQNQCYTPWYNYIWFFNLTNYDFFFQSLYKICNFSWIEFYNMQIQLKTYSILCLTLFSCLYLPQTKVIKEKKKYGTSNKQANKERKIKLMQIGNKIDENGSP